MSATLRGLGAQRRRRLVIAEMQELLNLGLEQVASAGLPGRGVGAEPLRSLSNIVSVRELNSGCTLVMFLFLCWSDMYGFGQLEEDGRSLDIAWPLQFALRACLSIGASEASEGSLQSD